MMHTDAERLKNLAAHLSELAVEGRRSLIDEHSASFRWLMASFLALNGGGMIGLKDFRLSSPEYALVAGISFFLGIVCALLIAFLGQKSNQRMIEPMSHLAVYWHGVSMTGEVDEAIQADIDMRIVDATKKGRWPSRAGFGSLAFFAAGLTAIAMGWVPTGP